MRLAVPTLLLLAYAGLAACGDPESEPSGPTACEVGPDLLKQSVAALVASSPACTADADCVLIDTDVHCPGFQTSGCGHTAVHHDAAPAWNSADVCRAIAAASIPSNLGCDMECASVAVKPACAAGVCTAVEAQ